MTTADANNLDRAIPRMDTNIAAPHAARWKQIVKPVLKLGVAMGLLAYLIQQAQSHQDFHRLLDQPKNWWLLLAAAGCCFVAVLLTFVRWYVLIRTINIPIRLGEALRLGFLGFLFNFVSLGNVGGDLFKAVLLARKHPGQRTEAVATVVADRLVGLYALFLLASAAILLTGIDRQSASEPIKVVCRVTLGGTAFSTLAIVIILAIRGGTDRMQDRIGRLPWLGSTLARLLTAAGLYRRNLPILVACVVASVGVHSLLATGMYLIARGLPGTTPSLAEHFLIVPVAMVVGAVPITPSGLGTFEAALSYMYRFVGGATSSNAVSAVIVALGYRLITVLIAVIGVGVFLTRRREVTRALHDAQTVEEDA